MEVELVLRCTAACDLSCGEAAVECAYSGFGCIQHVFIGRKANADCFFGAIIGRSDLIFNIDCFGRPRSDLYLKFRFVFQRKMLRHNEIEMPACNMAGVVREHNL